MPHNLNAQLTKYHTSREGDISHGVKVRTPRNYARESFVRDSLRVWGGVHGGLSGFHSRGGDPCDKWEEPPSEQDVKFLTTQLTEVINYKFWGWGWGVAEVIVQIVVSWVVTMLSLVGGQQSLGETSTLCFHCRSLYVEGLLEFYRQVCRKDDF